MDSFKDIESSPAKKFKHETSALQRLKESSQVVADTGDYGLIQKYKPTDSTTNPTLILQAAQQPQFLGLLDQSIKFSIRNYNNYLQGRKKKVKLDQAAFKYQQLTEEQADQLTDLISDKLAVDFGVQILKLIPGLVSTQVSALFSFDIQKTVSRALRLVKLYEEAGISRQRVLIKIAATWQGVKAAQQLKKKKINCNLTLIFSIHQAIACAQAGVYLISPFVGRILDWHKKNQPTKDFSECDPGVISVTQIYNHFKAHQYKTIVMGASFRNIQQVIDLAGCDKLTVSPTLLDQLANNFALPVVRKLFGHEGPKLSQKALSQQQFRWRLNEDGMATEKLSEGIRNFGKDLVKLKGLIINRLKAL